MFCETVKIVKNNALGYHIRNKSDVTPEDKIYKDAAEPKAKAEPKPKAEPKAKAE
jgi:hypothetical protein